MEFRAHQPVAVLAGMRTLVFANGLEAFLRDGPHRLRARFLLQVDAGADVQAADGSMGVPGTLRAVLLEDAGQAVGVVGKILQRHRAILEDRKSTRLNSSH